MTKLEQVAEAYWNAFRTGFAAVGGNPKDYPLWAQSNDPIKNETLRCLRHALEVLKDDIPEFDKLFPDRPARRNKAREIMATERAFAEKARS